MLHQPVGQKRLTNVAIVRLRSHGCKFEIACYKNKVGNWRDGLERDIDEVLTTTQVYTNVSQGVLAKSEDLRKAFGADTSDLDICKKILEKGEFQVSDKERANALESLYKEVYTIITRRCVNVETRRPLTIGMAEAACKQAGYVMKPNMTAKRQALKAIDLIVTQLPHLVAKAQMRLCARCLGAEAGDTQRLVEETCKGTAVIESVKLVDGGVYSEITFQCDPFFFRALDASSVEVRVLDAAVIREGDTNLEDEDFERLGFGSDDEGGASRHVEMLLEENPSKGGSSGGLLTRDRLDNARPGNVVAHPGGQPTGVAQLSGASAGTAVASVTPGRPAQLLLGSDPDIKGGSPLSSDSYNIVGRDGNLNPATPSSDWLVVPEDGATPEAKNLFGASFLDGVSALFGGGGSSASNAAPADSSANAGSGATGSCTTCGPFADENLRAHMKSERHQENVKRKCAGKPVFTDAEFKEYLLDLEFVNEHMGGKEKKGKKNRR
ncbi:unnamed protein product [Amoebophrya sp. A25]|nr:unnamed protein product [Amoebophrya sp. A25]|eukprot:GSA25T00005746001.1